MDADSANPNQRAVTPAPRWARILWFAFSLTALVATGIWAERVATGRSVDEQRALVPVSTVWGMHACFAAIAAGLGGIALPLAGILGRRRCLTALAVMMGGYLAC